MSKVRRVTQKTSNRFLNFYELEAQRRDGGTFPYYMASRARSVEELQMNREECHPDGVAIYGVYTPDGQADPQREKIVLVCQYRYPLGGYVYELPAGLTEPGEDIHEAAVREMKEETGLTLQVWPADPAYEKPYYMSVGMTDECGSLVYGRCSGEVSTEGLEATEELRVVLADRREALRILREECIDIRCALLLTHFVREKEDPFAFLELTADSEE